MFARLATAAVISPVLIGAVWLGGNALTALVAAVTLVAAVETSTLARTHSKQSLTLPAVTWALALVVSVHFFVDGASSLRSVVPALGGGATVAAVWLAVQDRSMAMPRDWALTTGVVLYTGGLLSFGLLLRGVEDGRDWVFLALGVTFAADTFAYFSGRAFGRLRMAPRISPGKTWEGAAGGLIAAVAMAVALKYAMGLDVDLWQMVVVGALGGVAGQAGDLVESAFKRAAGAKDSGWLIPGHGGVLDRIDSVVANLPLVYYSLVWWIQ